MRFTFCRLTFCTTLYFLEVNGRPNELRCKRRADITQAAIGHYLL